VDLCERASSWTPVILARWRDWVPMATACPLGPDYPSHPLHPSRPSSRGVRIRHTRPRLSVTNGHSGARGVDLCTARYESAQAHGR
jgi:hypothetical protein